MTKHHNVPAAYRGTGKGIIVAKLVKVTEADPVVEGIQVSKRGGNTIVERRKFTRSTGLTIEASRVIVKGETWSRDQAVAHFGVDFRLI